MTTIDEKALDEAKVADTWFTDSTLPVMAISGDVENDRVLKLHFRRPVTDQDRIDLTEALNIKMLADRHASSPLAALPPCGMREALEWAMSEIDRLANRLTGFAYPQAILMQGAAQGDVADTQRAYVAAVAARARAALSAPCGAGCGDGWRPRATAPKDGTYFLAYVALTKSYKDAGCSDDGDMRVVWWEARGQFTSDRDLGDEPFTHWRPLPAAPATGDA